MDSPGKDQESDMTKYLTVVALTLCFSTTANAQSARDKLRDSAIKMDSFLATMNAMTPNVIALGDPKKVPTDCSSAFWADAKSDLLKMTEAAEPLIESANRGDQQDVEALNGVLLDRYLMYGDLSLDRKCLDAADWAYRTTIKTFIGSSFSAKLKRAEIGVQDVRDEKSRSR